MVTAITTCIAHTLRSQIFRRLAVPNKKRISKFQQANKNSCDWEQVFPSYEYLGIDNVERRADESAPYIRSIPPAAPRHFVRPLKK